MGAQYLEVLEYTWGWIMAKTMTLGEVLSAHQDIPLKKEKKITSSWMNE